MIRPFPQNLDARRACHKAMVAAEPELMQDIAAIRKLFPGASLTYFRSSSLELGKVPGIGWEVDDALVARVESAARKARLDVEAGERLRMEAKRKAAIKKRLK